MCCSCVIGIIKKKNTIAHILFSQRFVSFSSLYGSTDVLYFRPKVRSVFYFCYFYLWKKLIFYYFHFFYLRSSYYKGVPPALREGTENCR